MFFFFQLKTVFVIFAQNSFYQFQWTEAEENALKQPIIERFEEEGHPYYSSARLGSLFLLPKNIINWLSNITKSLILFFFFNEEEMF